MVVDEHFWVVDEHFWAVDELFLRSTNFLRAKKFVEKLSKKFLIADDINWCLKVRQGFCSLPAGARRPTRVAPGLPQGPGREARVKRHRGGPLRRARDAERGLGRTDCDSHRLLRCAQERGRARVCGRRSRTASSGRNQEADRCSISRHFFKAWEKSDPKGRPPWSKSSFALAARP